MGEIPKRITSKIVNGRDVAEPRDYHYDSSSDSSESSSDDSSSELSTDDEMDVDVTTENVETNSVEDSTSVAVIAVVAESITVNSTLDQTITAIEENKSQSSFTCFAKAFTTSFTSGTATTLNAISDTDTSGYTTGTSSVVAGTSSNSSNIRQAKKRKISEEIDDQVICPMCDYPWEISGPHRVSALDCGHVYGHSCLLDLAHNSIIECPKCTKSSSVNEIRFLYPNSIIKINDPVQRRQMFSELNNKRPRLETEEESDAFPVENNSNIPLDASCAIIALVSFTIGLIQAMLLTMWK